MILCTKCWTAFKGIAKEGPCPDSECGGNAFVVDEMIAPAIRMLNQKKYYTQFCCAGHWYDQLGPRTYVVLKSAVTLPVRLPEGLKSEVVPGINPGDRPRLVISSETPEKPKELTMAERVRIVAENNVRLIDWVDSLPKFSSTFLIKEIPEGE